MRFPIAGLFFLILSVLLFIGWVVGSILLGATNDALEAERAGLDSHFGDELDAILSAFGVLGVFSLGLGLVIFIYDAMADEPEEYYRGY